MHIEWTDNLDASGKFKSNADLKAMYEKAGITPEKEVISYCQGGYRAAPAERPWASASGSVTLGFRTFSVTDGPSSAENGGRLSLRLRDLARRPLELRVRARGRRIERDGYGRSVAESQSVDRLYELSLAYDPPEGRFGFRVGRFATGPFAGMGYLDGALGEIRLGRRFAFGLFGGTRPDLEAAALAWKQHD